MEIDIPDNIFDQTQIAKVLSDLDAKIELNNKINQQLEAMAKTLYDYWFVQFDFPDANGNPYKSSGGTMVFDKKLKREIPEGWESGELIDLVDIINDNISHASILPNMPYVGIEHIKRKTVVLSTWANSKLAKSNKNQFKENDILFGKIRPYFHKVALAPLNGITSTDTIVFRPRELFLKSFCLETIFSDKFVETATRSSTGSKMPRADLNVLKQYKIPTPTKEILIDFEKTVSCFFQKMTLNTKENRQLTKLRDWLLPMLMNGQITVKQAQEEIQLDMVAEPKAEYKI
jgi:type I restriction enzyme S subunit